MLRIENAEITGWEPALRGMRNPMNSWPKADTIFLQGSTPDIGYNDMQLAAALTAGGPKHAKYRRMITLYCDITGPFYWWKQMDTYRMGVEKDSCSTMHRLTAKEFELADFSCEHMDEYALGVLYSIIELLNSYRESYLQSHSRSIWYNIVQLLPESYNQRRTMMFSYEALSSIYHDRKAHKLEEWTQFCQWIECLPYAELITGHTTEGADM